jgi:DNA-binding protein HU-beta
MENALASNACEGFFLTGDASGSPKNPGRRRLFTLTARERALILGTAGVPAYRRTPVNKNDLVQKLADHTGLPKMDAQKAVDGIFDVITASLKAGDEVRVSGFGVFVVSQRAGGKGRNPQTGEEITIKASKAPRFRPGKALKDMLNA